MEREQQQREREANNNNNNSNNDDGSNEITVESEASYVCVKCGGVPRIPVMCLFTHQIYCARGTPAELCEHTEKVSGGCGLYMQMKVTQPLVLESGKRAQVEPSMYLDRFGEEDVSLRRGRPLMLNPERYRSFLRFAVRCSWDHHTAMLEAMAVMATPRVRDNSKEFPTLPLPRATNRVSRLPTPQLWNNKNSKSSLKWLLKTKC